MSNNERQNENEMIDVRHLEVAAADDGQRLDRWLKKYVPELPFGLMQKLIRKGAIRVDSRRAKTDTRLAEGQSIRIPPLEEKSGTPKTRMKTSKDDPETIAAMVIYDDGDVVALNKPAGIAAQGGGGVERHIDGLLVHLMDKKERRPHLIHRLDRETSGVLLCARRPETIKKLGAAFRDRNAEKTYWALVTPAPDESEGTIKAPLEKGAGQMKDRMYVSEGDDAKIAVTDFYVVDRAAKKAAFLALSPRTGRTHQLRVHMADVLGCPIIGDDKYGGAEAQLEGAQEIVQRLHLHARRLKIRHPKSGEMLDFCAPLPADMAASWAAFGFEAADDTDTLCADGLCRLG